MLFKKKFFIVTVLSSLLTFVLYPDETDVQEPLPSRTQLYINPMNNIAMIFDLYRISEFRPFDILFSEFLYMLQEKNFPILVSDTLWNEFAHRKNLGS